MRTRRPIRHLVAFASLAALPILTGASAPDPRPAVGAKLRCVQQCMAAEEACFRSCGTCEDACYGKTEFCAKYQKKMNECRAPCVNARKDCDATC